MHQNFYWTEGKVLGPGKVTLFSSVTRQQQLKTEAVELAQKHILGEEGPFKNSEGQSG